MAGPPPSACGVIPAYAMRRSTTAKLPRLAADVSQGDAQPFPAAG
jgi:hypothetical protein